LPWYERFFGGPPSFRPNDAEAVWEMAEHRYIYIVQQPERAGHGLALSFVDDLDDRVASISQRRRPGRYSRVRPAPGGA
jgi:hypothetical protein